MITLRSKLAAVGVAVVATAAIAATAIADVATSAAPGGHYTGTSDAYNGATVEFDVDAAGNMSEFYTESYIQCGLFPTPMQWTGMPSTPVTAGEPFEVEWDFGTGGERVHYELSGVIDASGTASGEGVASMPELFCAGYRFTWTAEVEDPVVYDPEVSVSPSSVTESEIADPGVTVTGSGFAPESEVTLAVDGADVESAAADGEGGVEFAYAAALAPGEYGVEVSSADGSASTAFTVTEDPVVYDPEVSVVPSTVTESEIADPGVTVTGSGFAPESEVTLAVDGVDVESAAADGEGGVEFVYAAALAPGQYGVEVSSADGSASTAFTVTEDPVVYDPEVSVSPSTITESGISTSGVTVTGTGFAPESQVTLAVDGADIESAAADGEGGVEFAYAAALAPGEYPVVLSAAEGSASATLTVTEDPVVYDPEVSVSPSTVTESELVDPGVVVAGTGFAPESEVTLAVDGVDVESAAADGEGGVEFAYAAALAPGEYPVVLSAAEGSASTTFAVTEDPVIGDPQVTVHPSELTESEIADSGVTVTGAGFAPESDVTLAVDGAEIEAAVTDGEGGVEFAYAASLAPGEYPVVLSAAEGSASATFTVTEDPVVYDPQVELDPAEVTVSQLAEPGVAVHGSGFAPDSAVELQLGGESVTEEVADADGAVTFQLVVADADPGTYPVTLTAPEGTAEATLTVVADSEPGQQIPAEPPTVDALTPDTQGGITVPPTADEGATITVGIGEDRAGDRIGVWIFSDPAYLGTHVVGDDGTVQVELLDGVSGAHRIAAFAEDESIIGWDDIEITSGTDGSDDGTDDGSDGGSDDGTDGGDGGADGGDTGGPGGGDGGATGGDGDELPDTGTTSMGLAFGALVLLALGAALVLARRRPQVS